MISIKSMTMAPRSLIFITLTNGEYADRRISNEKYFWCGQNTCLRDHLVIPGTEVWLRENKSHLKFTNIGKVISKILIRPHDAVSKICATYELDLELHSNPVTIKKDISDRNTHATVLRHSGYPPEPSPFPHGIYASEISLN
jgi:hypothetical protein